MQKKMEAIYLGIKDWGKKESAKENAQHFQYRFLVNGFEECYVIHEAQPDFPLQNTLKVGFPYEISAADGALLSVKELPVPALPAYQPPVCGIPGVKTAANFLRTALEPVGTTLYVYGGGWNWQDEGPDIHARTLGVSPDWVRFFRNQEGSYTYKDRDGQETNRDPEHSFYPFGGINQYHFAGLDCSGYVGWAVYSTLEVENHRKGYVCGANRMAKRFAEVGLGQWTKEENLAAALKPGDIVSMDGHVWISVGVCADGSAVILHSTPSLSRLNQPGGGVQIGAVGKDTGCEAYRLADHYMTAYYPAWHERYETALKSPELYFSLKQPENGRFSWKREKLADPDGIREMPPAEALKLLFSKA